MLALGWYIVCVISKAFVLPRPPGHSIKLWYYWSRLIAWFLPGTGRCVPILLGIRMILNFALHAKGLTGQTWVTQDPTLGLIRTHSCCRLGIGCCLLTAYCTHLFYCTRPDGDWDRYSHTHTPTYLSILKPARRAYWWRHGTNKDQGWLHPMGGDLFTELAVHVWWSPTL